MNSGPYQPAGSHSHQTDYAPPRTSAFSTPGHEQPTHEPTPTQTTERVGELAPRAPQETGSKLANELDQFNKVAKRVRESLRPASGFQQRCAQAFEVANELFGNAPTWVCFYRELMGGSGLIPFLFSDDEDFGAFLRSDQYHQIQLMLTALRSRDMPENDPNDPQRMITVRLPKSLHEAMCDEAGRLNISVNRLCISRMLQLLDPKMIPETNSKPRGRKPRTRPKQTQGDGNTGT